MYLAFSRCSFMCTSCASQTALQVPSNARGRRYVAWQVGSTQGAFGIHTLERTVCASSGARRRRSSRCQGEKSALQQELAGQGTGSAEKGARAGPWAPPSRPAKTGAGVEDCASSSCGLRLTGLGAASVGGFGALRRNLSALLRAGARETLTSLPRIWQLVPGILSCVREGSVMDQRLWRVVKSWPQGT